MRHCVRYSVVVVFALTGSRCLLIDTVAEVAGRATGPGYLAILRRPGGVTADSFGTYSLLKPGSPGAQTRPSGAITTVAVPV